MRRVALPSSGLYPLAVLALAVLAYAGAAALHASGFAAVYVAALVLGNTELPHRAATRSFAEGVAWLAQIGLFVMLGLLVVPGPDRLRTTSCTRSLAGSAADARGAAAVGAGVHVRRARMSLRGTGVHVLGRAARRRAHRAGHDPAGRPGSTGRRELFDIVFVMVVDLHPAHRPDAAVGRPAARRRGPRGARDLDVEAAPLERIAADLLQISITRRSRMHGVEVGELRLPVGRVGRRSSCATARRWCPTQRTVLRRGDDLLVVTPRKLREATEDRLRAVSRRGRLAHWLDEPASTRPTRAGPGQPTPAPTASSWAGRPQTLRRARTRFAASEPSKLSPTTTSTPGPRSVVASDSMTVLGPNCGRPAGRRRRSPLDDPDLHPVAPCVPAGALPASPAQKPRARSVLQGLAGQPGAGAGVVDADRDLAGAEPVAPLHARRCSHVAVSRRLVASRAAARTGCDAETSADAPGCHEQHQQGDRGGQRDDRVTGQPATTCTRACSTWRCWRAARSARCRPSSR